jgi:LAO/AO transport system kinase
LLECADVFAVNKSDLPGADGVVENLRAMLALGSITGSAAWSASSRGHSAASLAGAVDEQLDDEAWQVPVMSSVASRNEGVADLAAQLEAHRRWLTASARGRERRRQRLVEELHDRVREALVAEMLARHGEEVDAAATQVELGALDPYAATRALIERWLDPGAIEPGRTDVSAAGPDVTEPSGS